MIFLNKKQIIIILVLILILIAVLIIKKNGETIPTVALPVEKKVVIIDAGHRTDQIMEHQVMKE